MTVKLLFYIIVILQEYLLILKHQPRISNLSHFQVFLERRFWLHSSFCLLINYYTKLISNPLEHKVQTGHQTRLLTRPHDRRSRPANYILTAWLFVTFWVDLFRILNFENRTTESKVGISFGFQIPSPKKVLKRTCFFWKYTVFWRKFGNKSIFLLLKAKNLPKKGKMAMGA